LNAVGSQRILHTLAEFHLLDRHRVELGGEEHADRLAQLEDAHVVGVFGLFHAGKACSLLVSAFSSSSTVR
jgi:hypothetical protein